MSPGEDVEKLRAAFVSLSEAGNGNASCPSPDRIWSAERGELSVEETRDLIAHTAECPPCAEAWRLARDVSIPGVLAPASTALKNVSADRRGVARYRWIPALAAAAAAVLVSAALLLRGRRTEPHRLPDETVYRDAGAFGPRSLLADAKALPRDRCVLKWSPGPPGSRYDIQIASEDSQVLHRANGLTTEEYRVPESALLRLAPGSRFLWQVEVVTPEGTRTSSATFLARLER